MEENPHRKLFLLTSPEAILIDPEKRRLDRPFSDVVDIVDAALTVLDMYQAYEPDEMYDAYDRNMSARRRAAFENKQRATELATGILAVAAEHLPDDYRPSMFDRELDSILQLNNE